MTDRGTATFVPTLPPILVEDYQPLMPGTGGSDFEPVRFIRVGGEWVPVQ